MGEADGGIRRVVVSLSHFWKFTVLLMVTAMPKRLVKMESISWF